MSVSTWRANYYLLTNHSHCTRVPQKTDSFSDAQKTARISRTQPCIAHAANYVNAPHYLASSRVLHALPSSWQVIEATVIVFSLVWPSYHCHPGSLIMILEHHPATLIARRYLYVTIYAQCLQTLVRLAAFLTSCTSTLWELEIVCLRTAV